ncbi:hypothetical protein GCM10023226_05410 [Nocardioides nanhaiensis]|uniref:Uncharacterized protein n=1 Tax=Nocardioides nanhaiensis TaxID=1476871 RepID=A0ABP8VTM9_9ACTN
MTPQIENAQPTGVIRSSAPDPLPGEAPGPLMVTTGATTWRTAVASTAHASGRCWSVAASARRVPVRVLVLTPPGYDWGGEPPATEAGYGPSTDLQEA